ncbi:hypothetical protein D3C80_499720 [compost metagenome]
MHDDVEAQLQRALHPRAGKGVIGNTQNPALATPLGDRDQISEAEQRIARRLHPDHTGVVLQRRFKRLQVAEVDKAETVTGAAPANPFKKAEGAAVQVVAGDNMSTGIQQFEDVGNGCEPRGKGERLGTALKVRDTTLQRPARRVVRTAVIQALVHARALLGIGGIGIDRRHQGPGGRVRALSGMDYAGGEAAGRVGFIVLAHGKDLRRWLSMSTRVIRP